MKKLTLFVLMSCIINFSDAAHLIGGRFQYLYLGNNTFRFELILQREIKTGGAIFESTFFVGLYKSSDNSLVSNLNFTRDSVSNTSYSYACNTVNRTTQFAYYSCIINAKDTNRAILNDPAGYYLNWERCCISNILINVIDPSSTPYSALLELPALIKPNSSNEVLVNNSPRLSKIFNPLICIGREFDYNFNFVDPDGDSLVYRLVTPNAGGYTSTLSPIPNHGPRPYDEITWASGYSLQKILDVTDSVKLNSKTGQLKLNPTAKGTYLFTIAIDEYRNNIKIGTVYFQSDIYTNFCNSMILAQPTDQYSIINSPVTFKMQHSDSNAKFSWQVFTTSGSAGVFPNSNADSLYIQNVDSTMNGYKYRCQVTTSQCKEYTNFATLYVRTTGINNINKEEIKLVPNPANSHIEFKDRYPRNIKVYNTAGTLVLEKLNCVELDISSLANGVYTIQYFDLRTRNAGFLKLVKTP